MGICLVNNYALRQLFVKLANFDMVGKYRGIYAKPTKTNTAKVFFFQSSETANNRFVAIYL